MAEYTTNFNLEKQQGNEYVSIEGLNANFDIIDAELKNVMDRADEAIQQASDKDATTVNGHTVESNVPANAKFTDTIYTHPATHPPTILASGTLPAGVVATNSTDYTTSRLRNAKFGTTEPTTLANGEVYFLYE